MISDTFPLKIPFWIRVPDLPLHFWNKDVLETIGGKIGRVVNTDSDEGKFQAEINALQPLETKRTIQFSPGEQVRIEFEYENLHKHCFSV